MQTNLHAIYTPHIKTPTKIVCTLNENSQTNQQSSVGKIKRFVLTQEGRTKLNLIQDKEFYAYPRLVTHVDDGFISTLTNLYRERLRPDMEILDLMSSWVSHLPNDVKYKRVVGHGMNAQELAKNPRLDYFVIKDLNKDQQFEFESCTFDAVLCTVSVQYLQQPEKVRYIPWPHIIFQTLSIVNLKSQPYFLFGFGRLPKLERNFKQLIEGGNSRSCNVSMNFQNYKNISGSFFLACFSLVSLVHKHVFR